MSGPVVLQAKDIPDEVEGTDRKGAMTGRERGNMRVVWTKTRVMVMCWAMEGCVQFDHGNGDDRMTRNMTKERAGRRGWA